MTDQYLQNVLRYYEGEPHRDEVRARNFLWRIFHQARCPLCKADGDALAAIGRYLRLAQDERRKRLGSAFID